MQGVHTAGNGIVSQAATYRLRLITHHEGDSRREQHIRQNYRCLKVGWLETSRPELANDKTNIFSANTHLCVLLDITRRFGKQAMSDLLAPFIVRITHRANLQSLHRKEQQLNQLSDFKDDQESSQRERSQPIDRKLDVRLLNA